jgi:hypothetical protein
MVNQVLNQVGKEVGFTKTLKGKKISVCSCRRFVLQKDVADPLNESERQAIYALQGY